MNVVNVILMIHLNDFLGIISFDIIIGCTRTISASLGWVYLGKLKITCSPKAALEIVDLYQ